ncbi:MAG TPA: hypothetical protein VKX28_02255 [Xanthobacteraceae bacterium]|nr:hypothetical protein [Xanthobacteraceae bacterium]
MKRRTKGFLLGGSLAVATVVGLSVALSMSPSVKLYLALMDQTPCKAGLRNLVIGCTFQGGHRTTYGPSHPHVPLSGPVLQDTSWGVTNRCPLGDIAKRLICRADPVAAPTSDDLEVELSKVTGLPLPKGRVVTTEINSAFIKSVHVETPFDLAPLLGFYRDALRQRGWTESDGAIVVPDHAVIAFTTPDGPALLRLVHQHGQTIADLSLRKPAAVAKTDMLPSPGQVKLMLGNATDEAAAITINGQTIKLAARAGRDLADETGRRSPDSPQIDLPPGKYTVTLKVASRAAQNREFEVGAGETWGLLVGPAGVPLPMHLY